MARIRDADVALVRERSALEAVIGETVTLRNAGGGRLKGLCPFHEEKTPSFNVNPSLGFYHCFGCGKSGDVISFVQETEALSFVEAVERLAQRAGVALTYEQGGAAAGRQTSERARLLAAHTQAAAFFRDQLASPEAAIAREFLASRGFDEASWARFGVGYAPHSWDALTNHLTGHGFSRDELVKGGLAKPGQRGIYDAFRGRLLWPIHDRAGEVIGFGARRLREDDQGPKYLNTGETPLYRKSHVLYGLDLARKEIALRHQAVVVEGYTDVMAAHLAGVSTAVATCGTAFGVDHVDVLRRLLLDDEIGGEVIFTFDGDSAGQKAALKAFELDQRFVTQTFVAVGPDGMDPCDLRLAKGDAAVRDLVASRVPLFTFVIRAALDRYDLETPEGRIRALAATAPIVAGIRDRSLRPEYARSLAGWLGMTVETVAARVAELAGAPATPERGRAPSRGNPPAPAGPPAASATREQLTASVVEREALKLAVQRPQLTGGLFDHLAELWFTVPAHRLVRATVARAGGTAGRPGGGAWVQTLLDTSPDDEVRAAVHALAVEPIRYVGDDEGRYATAVLARVQELAVSRELAEAKGRLERTNPEQAGESYTRLFGRVVELEARKRTLRAQAAGSV
ncbi:MAG TPA: DNA primase [Mycobacteriales bacterium]|nr:DNA primase [Mycobacteriales bacterium]